MEHNRDTKNYKISASYKKSIWDREAWTNKLSNGKIVTYYISTCFRWGSFEIELTDEEKETIMANNDEIILNDYSISEPEMWHGVAHDEEIKDENSYTTTEMEEIKRLLFYSKEDDEFRDEDFGVCTDLLEDNGWYLDDTEYSICGGCTLSEL
jgi:hypothetical protein